MKLVSIFFVLIFLALTHAAHASVFRIPVGGAQLPGGVIVLQDGTVHTSDVTTLVTGEVLKNTGPQAGTITVPNSDAISSLGLGQLQVESLSVQDGKIYVDLGRAIKVVDPATGNQQFLVADATGNFINTQTILGATGDVVSGNQLVQGTIGRLQGTGQIIDNIGEQLGDVSEGIAIIQNQVPAIIQNTGFTPEEFGDVARALELSDVEISSALDGQLQGFSEKFNFLNSAGLSTSGLIANIELPKETSEFFGFADSIGISGSGAQIALAKDAVLAKAMEVEQFKALSLEAKEAFNNTLNGVIDPAQLAQAREVFAADVEALAELAKAGEVSINEFSTSAAEAMNLEALNGSELNSILENIDFEVSDKVNIAAALPEGLSVENLPEMSQLSELRNSIPPEFMEALPLAQMALDGELQGFVEQKVTQAANQLVQAAVSGLVNAFKEEFGIALPTSLASTLDVFGTGAFGGGGNNYDDRQKNLQLAGTTNVKGSAPAKPMSAKTTKFLSDSDPRVVPVRDLTPWLYKSIMKKNDDGTFEFYDGEAYKFPKSSVYYTDKAIGFTEATEAGNVQQAGKETRFAACDHLIEPQGGVPEKWQDLGAPYIRAKLDACANYNILSSARFPTTNDASVINDATPENDCQLYRKMAPENEYDPATYIQAAWQKLLQDPSYKLRSGSAPTEPSYDIGVSIVNPVSSGSIGASSLKEIYTMPYEEIFDPSHPFSPRWDYENNERDQYQSQTAQYGGDPVYCAGSLGKEIKTDILEFRRAKFEAHIETRLDYNKKCLTTGYSNCCVKTPGGCVNLPCATCMGVSPKRPPCGTNYRNKYDRAFILPSFVPTQGYETAQCDPGSFAPEPIEQICHDLAKPYPPLNTVKMRPIEDLAVGKFANVDPESTYNEGLGFEDYFENRRPYPALPDTGTEAGNAGGKPDYMSEKGSEVAIVGVGREGERCMYGGAGGLGSNGLSISNPHPILSWTELKMAQANSLRYLKISCLPRFERLSKARGAEEMALTSHGVQFPFSTNDEGTQHRMQGVPLAFRGYINNQPPPSGDDDTFPHFGKDGGASIAATGLDNAKVGDIILMPKGGAGGSKPGIPTLGIVREISEQHGGSVTVSIMDNGKYPDACGLTDGAGLSPDRTFFKGSLPDTSELDDTDAETTDCEDPLLKRCSMKSNIWNGIQIYRPADDVRTESDLLDGK